MITPHTILKKYWNYDNFRPLQEDIVLSVLNNTDTLAILPTGGGKSICYQVPALVMKGSCIVVSPLIALMKDQAHGLFERGISCLVIHSGLSKEEVEIAYQKMSSGKYKFLFVSPERLKSELFLSYLEDWNINLIAVDEAHCISQWGYDFRPPYLEIALLRNQLHQVPVIALTASATPFVQQDIIEKLAFKNHQVFFSTFYRSNISFTSYLVENKFVKMIDILQKVKGTSIVYCRNRRRTKEIAETLIAAGLSADYYHAGLEQEVRNRKQEDWIQNKTNTIVCTNAFGMGIDKPDVRVVIHFDIPDTPEAYYQEAGRAGRDGLKSYAVLLYQLHDIEQLKEGIDLRYPSIIKMKLIYESLAHFLEVPLHEGFETVYDFDVITFCKNFDYNFIEVSSTIKLLEQQDYWTLSDSVFMPSRISVIGDKEEIEVLEKQHPDLDEILKHVLRLYSGIWNHFIPVRELQIAQHANVSKDYVELILRKLASLQIIDYIEAKDKPQLFYLHHRLATNLLQIDLKLVETLKARYIERVHFMIEYATQQAQCRANYLVSYFKEKHTERCGICDVCLDEKKSKLTDEVYNEIKQHIINTIQKEATLTIETFCQQYTHRKQEDILKIIRFLLDEGQVTLNAEGELVLNT